VIKANTIVSLGWVVTNSIRVIVQPEMGAKSVYKPMRVASGHSFRQEWGDPMKVISGDAGS